MCFSHKICVLLEQKLQVNHIIYNIYYVVRTIYRFTPIFIRRRKYAKYNNEYVRIKLKSNIFSVYPKLYNISIFYLCAVVRVVDVPRYTQCVYYFRKKNLYINILIYAYCTVHLYTYVVHRWWRRSLVVSILYVYQLNVS